MKKTILAVSLCVAMISVSVQARGMSHNSGFSNHKNVDSFNKYNPSDYNNQKERGFQYNQDNYNYQNIGGFQHNNFKQVTQTTTLTDTQKDDLIYMYQEEKVARDVYKILGEKWGTQVFLNIQQAEQRHMDAVKSLLIKYDIDIPDIEDEVGLFENEDLQALYNDLVEQGENSLEDALNVGVLIEETDISDLEEKIQDAPADIQRVFSRLLRGSNHHLEAFNRVISYIQDQNTDIDQDVDQDVDVAQE